MRFILGLIVLLAITGCNNDLNVIEDPKDIPIVYGFLSQSDSEQYIRVERAFVDATTSALVLANEVDSLYYDNSLIVEILDEETGEIYPLERVDGNVEGFPRDEGAFAREPNYLYKIATSDITINDAHEYTLQINRGEGFDLVTATTTIVGEARFIIPNPQSITAKLDFQTNMGTNFSWGSARNAVLYNLSVGINYVERMPGESFEDRYLEWPLAENLNDTKYRQEGRRFLTFLEENIPVVDDMERRFIGFDIIVEGGNNQLLDYIRVGQANLGITSTQDIPTYTNLSEGRGIFASRFTTRLDGVGITPGTLDSLVNSSITRDLNFTN